ncbi:MAG TPA: hypothetical protein ACFYD0_13560 [Candidatus Wunengus sp. YC65]
MFYPYVTHTKAGNWINKDWYLGYFRFHGKNTNWFNASLAERYDYLYT